MDIPISEMTLCNPHPEPAIEKATTATADPAEEGFTESNEEARVWGLVTSLISTITLKAQLRLD